MSYNYFHTVNIVIHVFAGITALLLGIVALITKKGKNKHKISSKWFLGFISFVIFTGLMGVFIFKRNTLLLVITSLSAYQAFSGYRVIHAKNNKAQWIDISMALITMISAIYFMYYIKSIGFLWSPIVVYSTLIALFVIIVYDFLLYLIPNLKYKHLWFYEHIYKMTVAFTALLSAFAGTVFSSYQPYRQILPSVFGIILQAGFTYYYIKTNHLIKYTIS